MDMYKGNLVQDAIAREECYMEKSCIKLEISLIKEMSLKVPFINTILVNYLYIFCKNYDCSHLKNGRMYL